MKNKSSVIGKPVYVVFSREQLQAMLDSINPNEGNLGDKNCGVFRSTICLQSADGDLQIDSFGLSDSCKANYRVSAALAQVPGYLPSRHPGRNQKGVAS